MKRFGRTALVAAGLLGWSAAVMAAPGQAGQAKVEAEAGGSLFAKDNLFAWCIVPFDAKKRGPEARELGPHQDEHPGETDQKPDHAEPGEPLAVLAW